MSIPRPARTSSILIYGLFKVKAASLPGLVLWRRDERQRKEGAARG